MQLDTFEAALADVQSEMVAATLEYAGDVASDLYIYGSIEDGAIEFDPFFVVQKEVVERHKLPGTDTSPARQDALLGYGIDQLSRLVDAGERFHRPVPTQLKLHYAVASGALDASYEYEPQYSHHPTLTTNDLVERWADEVRATLAAAQG